MAILPGFQKTTQAPVTHRRRNPSLVICIILDLIGYATYSIPFFGELLDLGWAPISGFIFYMMFGGWKGAIGGVLNFIEELLPGTDFIPSFTIMWLVQYFRNRPSTLNTYTTTEVQ
jgi:hypothetical protein